MNTLLLLSVLSGWSYEGFCDEPQAGAARPAPATVVIIDERPALPADPAPPSAIVPSRPVVVPPIEEPAVPPAPASVIEARTTRPADVPTVWHLVDSGGQVWNHTDAAWLRSWVESRNQAIARARVAPVAATYQAPRLFAPAATSCPGGRCPRTR